MKTIIIAAFIIAIGLVGCSISQPAGRVYYPQQRGIVLLLFINTIHIIILFTIAGITLTGVTTIIIMAVIIITRFIILHLIPTALIDAGNRSTVIFL